MIGPSKILTVSYGTFSCTLEGFDDPFNTMRAIAEYFRDLAAGDRYFGAEPPIPDAAMLHKIAEREIHRRVEAKIQENGVILRTGDAMSPAALMAAPAAPAAAPEAAPRAVVAAPAAVPAPSLAPPNLAPVAPAGFQTAAQRLSRLRAAQTLEPARVVPVAAPTFVEIYAEDQDVEPVPPTFVAEAAAAAGAKLAVEEPAEETLAEVDQTEETSVGADLADRRARDGGAAEPDAAADRPTPIVPAAGPVQLINTLDQLLAADIAEDQIFAVDQPDEAPVEDWAELEIPAKLTATTDQQTKADPAAPDWFDAESPTGKVIYDTDQDFGPDAALDDPEHLGPEHFENAAVAAEADLAEGDASEADDLTDTILASLASQTLVAEAPAEPLADFEEAGFDLSDALKYRIITSLAGASDAELPELADDPEPVAAPEAPETIGEAPVAAPAATEEIRASAAKETAVEAAPAPEPGEKIQRARARVIRLRRADASSIVIGRGSAPALAPPVEAVALAPQAFEYLSPEAEAALQRELATMEPEPQLDAGAEAALQAALDRAAAPAPTSPTTAVAAPQPTAVVWVDAVDRLMAETNSHLEVPETKRRQSTIAHLKAAVAATIAGQLSNPNADAQKAEARRDPYRMDLEQVVGPGRPGEVKGANRPAPLMLVSSQRIDRPKPAAELAARRTVQPVRPRRVTSGGPVLRPVSLVGDDDADEIAEAATLHAENIFNTGAAQSFAEFAERLGVSTMPDMLEAAAAYCALVLGREQFSRPLLLETVARLPGAEGSSLEDSLRGFGTLLRDGRITKVSRGQFQLAQDSHVLTEAKRFAG